jgi:hypothetical protein
MHGSKSSWFEALEAFARSHRQARIFGEASVALAAFAQPKFAALRGTNHPRMPAKGAQPDPSKPLALAFSHAAS